MNNMISITFHFIHPNHLSILIPFMAFPEAVDITLNNAIVNLIVTTCFTHDHDVKLSNDELCKATITTSHSIVSTVIYIHWWHKGKCCCYHLIFFDTIEMMIFSFDINATAWNSSTKNSSNMNIIFMPSTWLIKIGCFNSYHQFQTWVSNRNLVVGK